VLIDSENNILGEKSENFQNVLITKEDIFRIAIAVKDIEATVRKYRSP
jgi:hypothetical protein